MLKETWQKEHDDAYGDEHDENCPLCGVNAVAVVWHHYFDNSPRCDCCSGHLFDHKYVCPQPNNVMAHDTIEWLRFVWAVNKLLKKTAPYDFDWEQDDPYGNLGGFGSPLALIGTDNKPANIEDSLTGEIWRGVERYEHFTIYTNALTYRCLIECTNPEFIDLCEKAIEMVKEEYANTKPHVCVRL